MFGSMRRQGQAQIQITEDLGEVVLDDVCARLPRLRLVREIAEKRRFLHWELEFADLFERRGGFDLILGNPPWIKIEWNEGGVLSDAEPLFELRSLSAPEMRERREATFERYPALRDTYFDEFVELEGTQNSLNAKQNYPVLQGTQSNSYKCFVTQAWAIGSPAGAQGYVHPEGVYDDPRGGVLRRELYPRLRYHMQFRNEHALFVGTNDHGRMVFGVSIYSSRSELRFAHFSNLFEPSTVDRSFEHDGSGVCGGIKDENGKWNITGHRDRIIEVDEKTLELFARLYDDPDTPALEARLPSLHARSLVEVLRKFADYPQRLGDLEGQYESSEMWHETNAVDDGTIRRETRFPESSKEWVLSGPHIHIANPMFKTPRAICTANGHYDPLDLTELPADYLPRTNYVPACDPETYLTRTPRVDWEDQ